jgi:hypothetical protein
MHTLMCKCIRSPSATNSPKISRTSIAAMGLTRTRNPENAWTLSLAYCIGPYRAASSSFNRGERRPIVSENFGAPTVLDDFLANRGCLSARLCQNCHTSFLISASSSANQAFISGYRGFPPCASTLSLLGAHSDACSPSKED